MKKTIDLTPTWEQWMKTALFILGSAESVTKAIDILRPDFEKVAKLADVAIEATKTEEVALICSVCHSEIDDTAFYRRAVYFTILRSRCPKS